MVLGWRRSLCPSISKGEEKTETSKFRFFSSNPSTPRKFHSLPSSPRNNIQQRTSSGVPPKTREAEQEKQTKSAKKPQRFFSISNPSSPRSSFFTSEDIIKEKTIHVHNSNPMLKVYNDDECLMSATSVPEEDKFVEFQGFSVNDTSSTHRHVIDVKLSPEITVLSGKTYVVVLKVKAPAKMARRAPIDLVTILDLSRNTTTEKLAMMKRCMRLLVSSLSAADRLSIVAFSTSSKRLMPLRRMTASGRRSARRIVDAIIAFDSAAPSSKTDVIKKASKVLEDRRDKNPTSGIILLSDGPTNENRKTFVYSTRVPQLEVPVHFIDLQRAIAYDHAPHEDLFAKSIRDLLYVVVQNLNIQLDFLSDSAPTEIAAVYTCTFQPTVFGSGSIELGELFADEERELLVELKVPSSGTIWSHHELSVKCSYKDPATGEPINHSKVVAFLVPLGNTVKSAISKRLKKRFICTRAVAEARKLVERNELTGAQHMLTSARSLLLKSGSSLGSGLGDEFVRGLEAELSELNLRKQNSVRQIPRPKPKMARDENVYGDRKGDPLTPTSSWIAAEKLAKLAVMKKSLNKVSDMHGFENARF